MVTKAKENKEALSQEREDRRKAFKDTLTMLNKKLGSKEEGNVISLLSDQPRNIRRVSTGLPPLDIAIGGGYGKGRIIEIFGPESSGKTTVALAFLAEEQRNGSNAIYIDTEHALSPEYAETLGVDIENLALSQPATAEDALDLMKMAVQSGVVDTVILDSVAALTPKKELEGDAEDVTVGLLARLMSKTLKQLIGSANENGVTLVFINQNRVAIGKFSPFGEPTDTAGGKALKYYASTRIKVAGRKLSKDEGLHIILTAVKNKTAAPFRKAEVDLIFGKGFDDVQMTFEAGKKSGAISVSGRTHTVASTGELMTTKSGADCIDYMRDHLEVVEQLKKDIRQRIENPSEFETVENNSADEEPEDLED